MLARFIAIALLLIAPVALAAPAASPTELPVEASRYVQAEIALEQPDLVTIDLSGRLWIHRHDIGAQVYDADQMGTAYATDPANASALVAALEASVRATLEDMLAGSFPGATISDVTATTDTSTLRAGAGNPFDPPVEVQVSARVERTLEALGLGRLGQSAVDAVFAAGARVSTDLSLAADPGYVVHYTVHAPRSPAGVQFAPGDGVAADGRTLTVVVDNALGTTPPRLARATLLDPRVEPPRAEDIRTTIDVALGAIPTDASGIPLQVTVDAEVRALEVGTRFPTALPSSVQLAYLSADAVRALRASGALDDDAIADANEALLSAARRDLDRAFGGTSTIAGGFDTADLARGAATPFGVEPPLLFHATSNMTYRVAGTTGEELDLALRIGGAVQMDLNLSSPPGRGTTFTIHAPPGAVASAAGGGTVSTHGNSVTFEVPGGAAKHPASLTLRGRDAATFAREVAQVNITVDLKDLDVSIGEAVGGDMGDLLIEITVQGDLRVIEVPDALRASLPKHVDIKHLSSDAIRLLVARGKIDNGDVVEMEGRLLAKVDEDLVAALGEGIVVEGGIVRTTLDASLLQEPLSSDAPITFTARATIVKPLSGGAVQPQAAIALYSQALPLTLPKVEGLDTTYTVILPRGMSVTDLVGEGADYEVSRAPDGREQFVVRPTDERAEITATMAVTPTFVMIKFWPLVLLAIILLVLLVGTPIALVRMRRKKRKAAAK